MGKKVLLIDLDAQGNASTGLGVGPEKRSKTSYDVLSDQVPLIQAIQSTTIPNLDLIPASGDLAGVDLELSSLADRTVRLRKVLDAPTGSGGSARRAFDYILIDCPPSLSLGTINAMSAAHGVIVPLQCEFYALEGLSQLIKTVRQVKANLNPDLEIQGVVLTMFDGRNRLSEQVAADVRENLGDVVYRTVVPRNVRLSEAPSHGKPALLYDHACAGSQAYIKMASELLRRERDMIAA